MQFGNTKCLVLHTSNSTSTHHLSNMRCWHQPDQRPTDRWNKFIRFRRKNDTSSTLSRAIYIKLFTFFLLISFHIRNRGRLAFFLHMSHIPGLISATIFKGDSSKVESIEHFRPHDNCPNVIGIWITIYLILMNMYIHSNHLVLQLKWSACVNVCFCSFLLLERTG